MIAVLVIDDLAHAQSIVEATVTGGLFALDVTAGRPRVLDAAIEAAECLIVWLSLAKPLARAAIDCRAVFLSGTAAARDVRRGIKVGLTQSNFSRAMAAGDVLSLKARYALPNKVRYLRPAVSCSIRPPIGRPYRRCLA